MSLIAVIDTGVDAARIEACRIAPGVNLSLEGPESDTSDPNGHGTAIAAAILECSAAARVMPVKLMGKHGYLCAPDQLEAAFQWILERRSALGIAVVCAPFADMSHETSDARHRDSRLRRQIAGLREAGVPVVAPAGNWYALHRLLRPQGMAWPAILRETVSVGEFRRTDNGFVLSQSTQRLHVSEGTGCVTTVFAEPGTRGGTSFAAARIAGLLGDLRSRDARADVSALVARLLERTGEARDDDGLFYPALDLEMRVTRTSPGHSWLPPLPGS